MIRILFVCAGNTCRSPMAEAIWQQMVAQEGLAEQIAAASAGVSANPGEPTNPAAVAVLATHGVQFSGQARRFEAVDFQAYDRIVVMDRRTLERVEQMRGMAGGGAVAELLMSHAPEAGVLDVFDPYGTDRYEEAYELIVRGLAGLFNHVRKEQSL